MGDKSFDVVALGELLIDFTQNGKSEQGNLLFEANPGGAPANVLAMLRKLGRSAAFIGKVGRDAFGDALEQTVREAGIDCRGLRRDDTVHTTLAVVHTFPGGDRDFSFYRKPGADVLLRPEELDRELLASCRVFHFGTLSLTNEPAASATRKAIELAKAHGLLISLDPNLRKPLWKNEADAKAAMEWSLHQADIVKISDEEVDFLWGLTPEEGGKKLLDEYGVSLAYITLGPKGCYAVNASHHITVNSPSGIQVIDTTGAGDIFGGSAMSQFLQYKKSPSDLTEEELTQIVRFACTAASLSTQKHGGITSVPDKQEVIKRLDA